MIKKCTIIILVILSYFSAYSQLGTVLKNDLDSVAKRYIQAQGLKGAAISVALNDGSIWSFADGDYGNKTLNSDMIYEMGSNTKTMVSSIVLMLEEEGKIELSDSVQKYLTTNSLITNGVTINQLLNHTSGLYDYTTNSDFPAYVNSNPFKKVPSDSILKWWQKEAINSPGSPYSYCNSNYILLGLLIEKIEGKPFHTVLRERILTPLGMTHTYLSDYDIYTEEEAGFYQNNSYFDLHFTSFLTAAWSAGGLLSTTEDLSKYARKLYSGSFLSQIAFTKMKKTSPGSSYGLGLIHRSYLGRDYLGHGGATLQHSTMEYSPRSDFSIVCVTIESGQSAKIQQVHNALIRYLEAEIPKHVGIDEIEKTFSVNVYPNPATNSITVEATKELYNKGEMVLTDSRGCIVFNGKLNNEIDLSNLESGSYILKIFEPGRRIFIHRKIFKL